MARAIYGGLLFSNDLISRVGLGHGFCSGMMDYIRLYVTQKIHKDLDDGKVRIEKTSAHVLMHTRGSQEQRDYITTWSVLQNH